MKSSAYYFYVKTKILAAFQTCVSVPLMQIWKSANIFVLILKYFIEDFPWKNLSTLWDMHTWLMWKLSIQTFRNHVICWKLVNVLRNLQASRADNSIICRIKNTKISEYCFYLNTNIQRDFQVCFSVPLSFQLLNMSKVIPLLITATYISGKRLL